MTRNVTLFAAAALVGVALLWPDDAPPAVPAKPTTPVAPAPLCPGPGPCPAPEPVKPKPRPWGDPPSAPVGASVGGRLAPDGTPIQIDLPHDRHLKNKGGRDGSGLCVFTSIDMAADWHSETSLIGFRDWMTKHPGGGWPEKVDRMIKAICAERGQPIPPYINVSGADVGLIEKLLAAGCPVGMTYDHSPSGRYGGRKIAHMVNCVHARGDCFGVLDNNYPGADKIEWLTRREFLSVKPDWIVAILRDGPPPPPRHTPRS